MLDEGAVPELCVYKEGEYVYLTGRAKIEKALCSEKWLLKALTQMLNETQTTTHNKGTKGA